jgi:hypothetical protein
MYRRRKAESGQRRRATWRKATRAALLLAATLLIWAAQAVGARPELQAGLASAAAAADVTAAQDAQSNKLTVGVSDSGFAPSEASAVAGLVHLTLENRGGAERVKLSVAKQGGAVIRELEVEGRGGSLVTELEAAAGSVYTLTEEEHGWVFRLTVSGREPPAAAQAPPESK